MSNNILKQIADNEEAIYVAGLQLGEEGHWVSKAEVQQTILENKTENIPVSAQTSKDEFDKYVKKADIKSAVVEDSDGPVNSNAVIDYTKKELEGFENDKIKPIVNGIGEINKIVSGIGENIVSMAASINTAQSDIKKIKASMKNILDFIEDDTKIPNVLKGEIDIADIINNNTGRYTLFFPVGQYLISKPVTIINGIYGATNSPGAYKEEENTPQQKQQKTVFISDLDEKTTLITNAGNYNTIENICIICNENTQYAIRDQGTGTTIINNIGIDNLGTGSFENDWKTNNWCYGICIDHSVSRAAVINNIYIYGAGITNSIGIRILQGTDIRITNAMIMGCQIGIDAGGERYTPMVYGDNIHIWTGKTNQSADNFSSYYQMTCGLYLNSGYYLFNNLYIDSAKTLFYLTEAGASVDVNNLMTWCDLKIDTDIQARLCTNILENNLNINNGVIYAPKKYYKELFYEVNQKIHTIKNVKIIVEDENNFTADYDLIYPIPEYGYPNKYYCHSTKYGKNQYYEIARMLPSLNGPQYIEIGANDAKTKLIIEQSKDENDNISTSITPVGNINHHLCYKQHTGGMVSIYSIWPWITCETSFRFVNFDYLMCNNRPYKRHYFAREQKKDENGNLVFSDNPPSGYTLITGGTQ